MQTGTSDSNSAAQLSAIEFCNCHFSFYYLKNNMKLLKNNKFILKNDENHGIVVSTKKYKRPKTKDQSTKRNKKEIRRSNETNERQ